MKGKHFGRLSKPKKGIGNHKKNKEKLIETISAMSLNALEVDMKPLGLSVADKADLLTRICIGQGKDENLKKVPPNEKTEYETSKNGTIVVNG